MKDSYVVIGLIALLVILAIFTLIGTFCLWNPTPEAKVEPVTILKQQSNGTAVTKIPLFVLIHGLDNGKHWPSVSAVLQPYGDVLPLKYHAGLLSNAKPENLAGEISKSVEQAYDLDRHGEIVLIGESMGALIARRAFLDAEQGGADWAKKVHRLVLLAGMNRGWDISGKKPADMTLDTWLLYWIGFWSARVTGTGKFIRNAETGAPFVANLRLDWMKRFQRPTNRGIEVVQLLGDIDDIVSDQDNKDLLAMATKTFAWIRVRGTGHAQISDFEDFTKFGDVKETLGSYRKQKFLLAATAPFSRVLAENEEQPFQPDLGVKDVVFVLHGIRDLGEWASAFEKVLLNKYNKKAPDDKFAIASIRYGYFGMGPFLLQPGRQKYVKWLMDEYTETLARYPNAERVHFVAHSNGTYLLAAALEQYESMKVDRVVLGGSVVRKGYNWSARFKSGQVKYVRNYVAADDWVVALFPRFFEPKIIWKLLGNDIGSAGFNGFDDLPSGLENVRYVTGGHAAFLNRIHEIADLLLANEPKPLVKIREPMAADQKEYLKWASNWGDWFVVWPLLAAAVLFVGWHVVVAATEPRWPMLLIYLLLVLGILKMA